MNKTQIQNLIENLRMQTAANSITPNILANILTELNNASGEKLTQPPTVVEKGNTPLLYCEVRNGSLYLRNYEYYKALELEPILFRYTRKRNRWENRTSQLKYGPRKKGWFANGKQGTLKVDSDGLVKRNSSVLNCIDQQGTDYRSTASTFVQNDADSESKRGVTWGTCQISRLGKDKRFRMLRLPFAIGFAPRATKQTQAITVADLVSNLAPFYVRGMINNDGEYEWFFSR